MAFNLQKIENPDFYIDFTLRKARERVSVKSFKGDKVAKNRQAELIRFDVIDTVLSDKLRNIHLSYPRFDDLTDFYKELVKITIDAGQYKKSCAAIKWADNKVSFFCRQAKSRIAKSRDLVDIKKTRDSNIGRIVSVVKQIKSNLKYLDECRRVFKDYPTIKSGLNTIALYGFPNVGKTTLLTKLTSATPEISNYAFTTKKINIGYHEQPAKNIKLQILDTPGTLNRFNKMNLIEKQADLALKHCADLVVVVLDLTGTTYLREDQDRLLDRIIEIKKPFIVYLSKTDMMDKETIEKLQQEYNAAGSIEILIDGIKTHFKKHPNLAI
ncbi:50S ribosome-binding GTPase [Candidatus Woesearchaeota archaeon]|nr:50S ribosome-binding GTPase [Candidatus Woesearchaeota archaeon]